MIIEIMKRSYENKNNIKEWVRNIPEICIE